MVQSRPNSNLPSPEEAKVLLWRRGCLSWKLRPEQNLLKEDLEKTECQLAVYNISRRWGKTFTLVTYAIEQAIRYKQKIRFACAFLTDLEEFILPAFSLILEDCPEDLRPHYVRNRKTWTFPSTGSEIKLVGLDKSPQGLRGNAIAKIIVDEAGFVSNLKHVYTNVIIPATAKQKNIKLIFLSTPPPTPDHFFVELIAKATTQANGRYSCLTIDDISDLDPLERKRLLDEIGGEHSSEAQREFFCRIIIDKTIALTPEFDESKHVYRVVKPTYCKYWLSGDIGGVNDRSVFHVCAYDFARNKILILDERAFPPNTSTAEMVKSVREMELAETGANTLPRHVDCAGQNQVDLMTQGFACALPRKDELIATVNQVRVALTNNQVEVDAKCKLLIATLLAGTFNRTRTDLARTDALGHMDAFMSFAYGLRHTNKTNPFPRYDNRRPIDIHIPDSTLGPQTESARVLKSIFTPR